LDLDYRPVFLVGHPRSGTTWLFWLLAHHPNVVASYHSGLFLSLAPFEKWRRTPGSFGKFLLPAPPAADGRSQGWQASQIDLLDALPSDLFTKAARQAASTFFDSIAAHGENPLVVVENTPENLEILPWILDVMPEASVLHMIRDPRSIWLSIRNAFRSWMPLNSAGGFPRGLAANIGRWRKYMEIVAVVEARTDSFLAVRYERLKADGTSELARIYSWLGLPADLSFCEAAIANSEIEKMKQQMPAPEGFFGRGSTEGWRESLSGAQVRQIEYLVGDWMDRLGYERQWPVASRMPWQLRLNTQLDRLARFLQRRWGR
jgi:hypothetical protein